MATHSLTQPVHHLLVATLLFPASATFAATTLTTPHLSATITVQQGHFHGLTLHDALGHRTLQQPEAFTLTLDNGTQLHSSTLDAQPAPSSTPSHPCWTFKTSSQLASFQWCVLVRPGTDYIRESLSIATNTQPLPLREVRLLDIADPQAHVVGTVKGSPIVSGNLSGNLASNLGSNLFYGFEHPLSANSVVQGHIRAALPRILPLQAHQSVTYSAVIGTAVSGQLRRAFLAYIEAERPRPYQPFLHYNSWFDLGYTNRFSEAGALDRIHTFGTELVRKRQVQLDSFLFDDGWDDPNTLWGFDSGFPHGFSGVGKAAADYHSGVGAWLSPWGGYAEQKQQRIAYGKAHGYEILNDGYALSGPKYYKRFEATCLEMVRQDNFNQFKFDGTGNADRVFPGSAFDSDFDAAIHLIERLRSAKKGLFINLTTGTTASPFWLFYADSIWRGGDDSDFAGVGTDRQRWITYRDAQTYSNIAQQGPLFPLNSLMLHGIIYAKSARKLSTDPGNDFPDEVHSYFGSGTQLQELYITPSLLTPANWDTLAAAARWSRAHQATLKDTHWLGGDPGKLQVYGWAAWSPQEGIVTLRNPSAHPQTFTLDVAKAFELPTGAPSTYTLHNVWAAANGDKPVLASASHSTTLTLAPFQVLTLAGAPTS